MEPSPELAYSERAEGDRNHEQGCDGEHECDIDAAHGGGPGAERQQHEEPEQHPEDQQHGDLLAYRALQSFVGGESVRLVVAEDRDHGWRQCSLESELRLRRADITGGADGNRTRAVCLGSRSSTIELQPRVKIDSTKRTPIARQRQSRNTELRCLCSPS